MPVTAEQSDIAELAFRGFLKAYGLVQHCMRPYFAQFNLSGAQWGILRQLHRAEAEGLSGLRPAELGQRLLVKPPSITTVIDRLEREGLIARETEQTDRRAKRVRLTPRGQQMVRRVLRVHTAQLNLMMAGLNAAEQVALHKMMTKLASHLEVVEARMTKGPRE